MGEGRVIGLISGKGGVGKTSICANLAVALREMDNEVTVVDTDFSASNLSVHMGRYDHPVKIHEVLEGQAKLENGVFRHPTGVKALMASNVIQNTKPDTSRLREVLNELARNSDYVLVDCPPGLTDTVEEIMESCDELIIVTTPTQSSGTNAAQIVEKAKRMAQPVLGTVLNKVEDDPEKELVEREVEMMTESHIIAEIPYDHSMKKALFHNTPLVLYEPLARASMAVKKLGAEIDGQSFEEPRFLKLKRGVQKIKETVQ